MNKNIALIIVLLGLLFWLPSCSDDDDKNEVSQEWKDYHRDLYNKIMLLEDASGNRVYQRIESVSEKGDVYVKKSDYITKGEYDEDGPVVFPDKSTENPGEKVFSGERPNHDTDVVLLRYEGWYYNLDNKRVVFDSTEKKDGNGVASKGREMQLSGVIDGFKTLLQTMKEGEEKIVCMPYWLGYDITGSYDPYTGTMIIPGYTTLFFDVLFIKNITAEKEKEQE